MGTTNRAHDTDLATLCLKLEYLATLCLKLECWLTGYLTREIKRVLVLCVSCASGLQKTTCHNDNRICVISKQTVLETRTLFVPKNRTFVSSFPSTDFFSLCGLFFGISSLSFPVFILFSLLFLFSLEHTTESMAKTQNVSYKDTAKLGC